eukprot:TRINITY_DN2271_c0_g3_i5.p1 TRINITY_DN2271_c0_g3~~TRINITY_DN2271_c0_g3_i5.p1  ORF type:complete len:1240 (-),score=432.68 TRINITY_DN2271_c0_g3_i5:147-3866(-)
MARAFFLFLLLGLAYGALVKEDQMILSVTDEQHPPRDQIVATTDGDQVAIVEDFATPPPFVPPETDDNNNQTEEQEPQDDDSGVTGAITRPPTDPPADGNDRPDPVDATNNAISRPNLPQDTDEDPRITKAVAPDAPLDVVTAKVAALFNETTQNGLPHADSDVASQLLLSNTSLPDEVPLNFDTPANTTLDNSVFDDLKADIDPTDLIPLPNCPPKTPCNVTHLLNPLMPNPEAIIDQVQTIDDPDDEYTPPDPPEQPERIMGHIRVFSLDGEDSDQMCLREVITYGLQTLDKAPCSYDDSQLFIYDSPRRALFSIRSYKNDTTYRVELNGFKKTDPLSNIFVDGQHPLIPAPYKTINAFVRWTVSTDDYNAILIDDNNPNTPEQYCLMTADTIDSSVVTAVVINNDTSACSAFLFSPLQDDYVTGRIAVTEHAFKFGETMGCLTYTAKDEDDHPSGSRLHVEPCMKKKDPRWKYQQFLYNTVTYHLRTFFSQNINWMRPSYGNPMLFFWWKGAIKHYFKFEERNSNYGWRIPLGRPGAITVVDNRGYSGECMFIRRPTLGVFATQRCHSFIMIPDKTPKFLLKAANPARTYTTVQVQAQIPSGNQTISKCLAMSRVVRRYNGRKAGYIWQVNQNQCGGKFSVSRRFMISTDTDAGCDNKQCVGHIRWAGDPGTTLFTPQVHPINIVRRSYIEPRPINEDTIPYQMNLPINRWAPITTTHKGLKMCWNFYQQFLVMTSYNDISECTRFKVSPIRPAIPAGVTMLQQFDSRSIFYMPSNPNLFKENYAKKLVKLATQNKALSAERRGYLRKFFDVYYSDMGEYGDRRYRAVGRGAKRSASGQVDVNSRGRQGGVYLPFWPHKRLLERYGLIDVHFVVHLKDIAKYADADKGFTLFSFAGSQGCTLYITPAGLPGVVCRRGNVALAQCQVRRASFHGRLVNLLDGRPHTVGLLFSRHRGGGLRVYIDNVQVLYCTNSERWMMVMASRSLWFFNQPGRWFYQPLPGVLFRASVYTSDDAVLLDNLAEKNRRIPAKSASVQPVGSLRTEVRDCKEILDANNAKRVIGLRCKLHSSLKGKSVSVPVTTYSLACSRPNCDIFFPKRKDIPFSHAHEFIYLPNYPGNFTSEDVGDPDMISDMAFISDGFSVFPVKFGIQFDPDGDAKLETNSQVNTATNTQITSQVGAIDFMKYRCTQSCCATVGAGRGAWRDDDNGRGRGRGRGGRGGGGGDDDDGGGDDGDTF